MCCSRECTILCERTILRCDVRTTQRTDRYVVRSRVYTTLETIIFARRRQFPLETFLSSLFADRTMVRRGGFRESRPICRVRNQQHARFNMRSGHKRPSHGETVCRRIRAPFRSNYPQHNGNTIRDVAHRRKQASQAIGCSETSCQSRYQESRRVPMKWISSAARYFGIGTANRPSALAVRIYHYLPTVATIGVRSDRK